MEIRKEGKLAQVGLPTESQLADINALAKGNLTAQEVYVFSLRLCDDQPDRDYEQFATQALPDLARLFVGKTGILDHNWSAAGQVARIFQTQVERQGEVSFIKAWAYLRRDPENTRLIADIEAGIKKEVSVGCAMGGAVCSVCGAEYGACGHEKGRVYDGKLCTAVLVEPRDAYEFSFVAVPAQREAGVMKGAKDPRLSLEELVQKGAGAKALAEYRSLKELARAGSQWQAQIRKEVVRLGMVLELGLTEENLQAAVSRLPQQELLAWQKALQRKAAELFPPEPQLWGMQEQKAADDSGFLI